MELFVINRHDDEKYQNTEEEEKRKLDSVLKRIEKKKQARVRQRERQKQAKLVTKTRRKQKNQLVKVPENEIDEFIDTQVAPEPSLTPTSFTVLGADTTFKKNKATRVLPQWLAKPTIISSNLQQLTVKVSAIKQLDRSIRKQLKLNGVKYFFPVQAEVIPWLLDTRKYADVMFPPDVCVSAPTGSGKTLAFVLPVIQALKQHTVRRIRALVILPTQDLADQVFRAFKIYTSGTKIEPGLISGKHVFTIEQQQLGYFSDAFGYVSKIDILVCTAGRLVGHLKSTKGLDLNYLEFLIIDEADRVLENVQDDWLYHLEKHISVNDYSVLSRRILNLSSLQKRGPQKLLFSATLSQDPEKLEKLALFQPKLFTSVADTGTVELPETAKYITPKELTEKYIVCTKHLKPLVLFQYIQEQSLSKTIVFTHSVDSAHRLKILLQALFKSKLKIEEISSSLKGTNRDHLISQFTQGHIDLLICTDSLARGIDLPGIKCVISYSAPKFLKTYIHRVGRTARAGEQGTAVTIVHNEQQAQFKTLTQMNTQMEQVTINEENLLSLGKLYKKALSKLQEIVHKETTTGLINLRAKKKLQVKSHTPIK